MSNLASALNGASFNGLAKVDEAGLVGMITLRGDLGSAKVAAAVKAAFSIPNWYTSPTTINKAETESVAASTGERFASTSEPSDPKYM